MKTDIHPVYEHEYARLITIAEALAARLPMDLRFGIVSELLPELRQAVQDVKTVERHHDTMYRALRELHSMALSGHDHSAMEQVARTALIECVGPDERDACGNAGAATFLHGLDHHTL